MNDRHGKITRLIARRFAHSHMSDAKWRKAFSILAAPNLGLRICYFKYVDDTQIYTKGIPQDYDLLETHFADGSFSPEIEYREIEWIEIPREYVLEENETMAFRRVFTQDIQGATEALNNAGQFPVELTAEYLRIYGYS